MIINIEFVPSPPTEKMWAFAQSIANGLGLEMPEKTYEATHEFIETYHRQFYRYRRQVHYDFWEHMFWMSGAQTQEEVDYLFYCMFAED